MNRLDHPSYVSTTYWPNSEARLLVDKLNSDTDDNCIYVICLASPKLTHNLCDHSYIKVYEEIKIEDGYDISFLGTL
jgi:hypothetical protein